MLRILDTADVRPAERFDYWHNASCRTHSFTECVPSAAGDFWGRMVNWDFGLLQLSEISISAPHTSFRYKRSQSEIAKDGRDDFSLFLVLDGEFALAQSGREGLLKGGDLLLYHQAHPWQMESRGSSRITIVTVPYSLMIARLSDASAMTARQVKCNSKLGGLAAGVVRQCVELGETVDASASTRLGASMMDIVATALDLELQGTVVSTARNKECHRRVKKYILANLHDPNMDVDSIARAHNITTRTLHRLFVAEGSSPIRWMWQQRLAASYKALAEGQITQVTDAALSFGFCDLSHFSRTFKKTFGCSPHTVMPRGSNPASRTG